MPPGFASSLASGFALGAALIVAIGAQNLFVLRQGLRREHVGVVVAFCTVADLSLMAAGVSGIGVILRAIPGLALGLTLGGAAFLLFYGVGALRRAASPERLVAGGGGSATPVGVVLGKAAAFTLLNPHVYLDTVLLVGTVGNAQPGGTRWAFVVGASAASCVWFVSLGFGARLLAPVFARPGAWRVLDAVVAVTMIALAGLLLVKA